MTAASQKPASSDWLKVMIEEVARKRDEAEAARREQALRAAERRAGAGEAAPSRGSPPPRPPGRGRRKTNR